MKIMLIDDKTTDVVTKLKDLKRRYHHVQVFVYDQRRI